MTATNRLPLPRRGLRRALGLVRRDATCDQPSPSGRQSPLDLSPRSPSCLSSSSLSSATSTSSSLSNEKPTLSVSRKGVTYDVDGAVVCCRFCDILRERDADFIYEDQHVAVFRPLAPVADSHVLVVPRHHIRNINSLTAQDTALLKHMREVAELVLHHHDWALSTQSAADVDAKFAFHTPPFNSIDHVHMHAFRRSDRTFGCRGSIKYRTDTWWCQSFDEVLSRVAAKSPTSDSCSHCDHQCDVTDSYGSTR